MTEIDVLKVLEVLLIIAAVYGAYWKQKVQGENRFTKLEVLLGRLANDHEKLEERINGMSRHLSEIKGYLEKK